jgi:hypothetical protein
MSDGDKALTIGLTRELHRELKVASAVMDCSMKDIVLKAIRSELDRIKSELRGKRNGV